MAKSRARKKTERELERQYDELPALEHQLQMIALAPPAYVNALLALIQAEGITNPLTAYRVVGNRVEVFCQGRPPVAFNLSAGDPVLKLTPDSLPFRGELERGGGVKS